ncbi:tannase and feruloyl esterase [Polyplosphaeria fusca]|uniref:Carboxylic ester hydrolase n=1 Tax=Polyplosphaeria fusca TaxID=682080 RepID=A0A9P4QT28_9PLEO|nr:tannase and feruloyl esterase [Polyplosphaeria fusca]
MAYLHTPTIACTASSFPTPILDGVQILSLDANLVPNYTAQSPPFFNPNHGTISPVQLDFCNVTIIHTHPSRPASSPEDRVETQIWLPTKVRDNSREQAWNGRLQAVGGGGFIAGLYSYMLTAMDAAMAEGYATVATNAGIYATDINGGDADSWFLPNGPGKPDYFALENFAYRSIGEMGLLAKQVVKSYYGSEARYSYFSGCSNGGRQGYVLAQRYPDQYNGIAACAPALYTDEWVENYWAQQIMKDTNSYPWLCELNALSAAAVATCDLLDGVEDGILQEPDKCAFDPYSMLGESICCTDKGLGGTAKVSEAAVLIAQGTWTGNRTFLKDVHFRGETGGYDVKLDYAGSTTCSNITQSCMGGPDPLTLNLMRIFVQQDKSWDPRNITDAQLEAIRLKSLASLSDIGTNSHNLSAFKQSGGKMITYHGTSDPAVSYKTSRRFYDAATKNDGDLHDFYRLFLAPGLGHGVGGRGAYPHTTFRALVKWVEGGVVPGKLEATSEPDGEGRVINRILCAYPQVAVWDGVGSDDEFESWKCA